MRALIIAKDSESARHLAEQMRIAGIEPALDLNMRGEMPSLEKVECDCFVLDWNRFGRKSVELCRTLSGGTQKPVFVTNVPRGGGADAALTAAGAAGLFSEKMEAAEIQSRLKSGFSSLSDVFLKDRFLFDALPAMIWVKDSHNRILRANKFAAASKGMEVGDMEGRMVEELYPDEAAKYHADDLEVIQSGKPKLGIMEPYQDKSGAKRWVCTDKIPFNDAQGKVAGVIVFVSDVTDQKRVEEELRYRIRFEEVISTLSTRFILVTPEEVDAEIHRALQVIGEFAGVDRSYVFLCSDDLAAIDNTHEWCAPGIEPQIHRLKNISAQHFSWFMERMKRFETVHIPSVQDLPSEAAAEKEEFLNESIQSLVCVPMISGQNLIGFVGFDSVRRPMSWSEDQIAFLRIIGEMFANALQRRRSAHYVQASESLYGSVISSMEEGIVIQDTDGVIQTLNPSAQRILGLPSDEMMGRKPTTVWDAVREDGTHFPEGERPSVVTLRTGQACSNVVMGIKSREGLRWISVNSQPIFSTSDTEPNAVVLSFTEVTERKKAEKALLESEAKYRLLFENNPMPMWVIDAETLDFLAVNDAAVRHYGYSREEFLSMRTTDIRPVEEVPRLLEAVKNTAKLGSEGGWKHRKKDGTIIEVEVSTHKIEFQGRPAKLVLSNDITERVRAQKAVLESELKYRNLFQDSRDAIFITAKEGRFMDANPAALDFFGYSREELLKLDVQQVYVHPDSRMRFQEEIERKGSVKDFEVKLRRKDGSEMDCLITATVKREAGGYQSIVRDVTERKRLQEAMLHAQKLESLGVLAGGIAHDFNNLLAVILGNTELALEMLPAGSQARDFLKQVEISSHRGAELCKQMLAYSGKGRFVVQPLDLNSILEEMTDLLGISVLKGAMLKYDLSKNLPAVMADATQVRQIVMNLVINASDAIGAKNGTIEVRSGTAQIAKVDLVNANPVFDVEEGPYVYLEVKDNGHGMDEQTRTRIFDPFFTTKFDGRGLGLAAVLGIVRGHHGILKVESEKGVGSTFRVYFPCVHARAETVVARKNRDDEWRGDGTILVVDDDPSVRTVVAQMVSQLGFDVLTADDGLEGLKLYQKHQAQIRLVLLDMTMPRMNAEEFFEEVRRFDPSACVLLMSGYTKDDVTARFIGKGLAGFVQKPFKSTDLRDRIRSALRRSAKSGALPRLEEPLGKNLSK